MKKYRILGQRGKELCKAGANSVEEVIKLLEAERDKTSGQKIFGIPVGEFIYNEWVKGGKKIIEVRHGPNHKK